MYKKLIITITFMLLLVGCGKSGKDFDWTGTWTTTAKNDDTKQLSIDIKNDGSDVYLITIKLPAGNSKTLRYDITDATYSDTPGPGPDMGSEIAGFNTSGRIVKGRHNTIEWQDFAQNLGDGYSFKKENKEK